MTTEAKEALGSNSVLIRRWPFRIGRWVESSQEAVPELAIKDQKPYRVSRQHLLLKMESGRIAVYDSGSRLGSLVGGIPLGGNKPYRGPVCLSGKPVVIVLGGQGSKLRYELVLISGSGGGKERHPQSSERPEP